MIPFHRLDEISGIHRDDGTHTVLALLLSDQCPYGITVTGPDGSLTRVSGSVLTILNDAKEITINNDRNEFVVDISANGDGSILVTIDRAAVYTVLNPATPAPETVAAADDLAQDVKAEEKAIRNLEIASRSKD